MFLDLEDLENLESLTGAAVAASFTIGGIVIVYLVSTAIVKGAKRGRTGIIGGIGEIRIEYV